jgi:hypothetical protein
MSRSTLSRATILSLVLATAALLPALLPDARVRAQTPSFRARADLVAIDVSVRRGSRAVTGLGAGDFEVLDNGVPQQISQLAYETLPIDLTVLIDLSESVNGAVLEHLRRSIEDLARELSPRDRLALVTFNVRIRRAIHFGAPMSTRGLFDGVRGFGGTSVLDAIAVALTTTPDPERRQLVIVFSDGEDRSSVTARETLLDVARRTTPTLGVVLPSSRLRTGLLWPSRSTAEEARKSLYLELASETGGFLETIDTQGSLSAAFRKILRDFRRSYVLYFSPTDLSARTLHNLEVRAKRQGVEVRARRNYLAR